MESNFNAKAADDTATVSLNGLRGQIMKRLEGAQSKLESKGIDTASLRAGSRADTSADSGFMGGLIMDMIFGGAVSVFLGHGFQVAMSAFNEAATAGLESLSLTRDQLARGYRARQLNDYPEGRRRCALEEAAISRKFNLVSANQNHRLSFDTQAEVACMFEMLDMLDTLEKEGIHAMRLNKKESVYDVLKESTKKLSRKAAARSFATPMQMAV